MCGVVGIASTGPVDTRVLGRAVEALRHRGPDGEGLFVDSEAGVGLGHTRLSIIDLSDAAAQPMASADGRYVITFNGEIYNFREIARDLEAQGVRLRTRSDTEVLVEAWANWGEATLDRLNGIFAFAVLDRVSRALTVARDPLGVKPLYYAEGAGGVVFASEIKALLAFDMVRPELDAGAMARYMTFLWSPGEQTPFSGVKKLGPGMAMRVESGRTVRRWAWWTPADYAPDRHRSVAACADELSALIDTCVERQMVSDAPLGSFLSGGLDSSAIVASASRLAPDIRCFTIDTPEIEEGAADDLPYARAAARHLGVRLEEVRVDARDLVSRVEEMVWRLDEPLADPACLNVLFISELARSHGIKVLLSGAGGDDLFTGYRRHTMLALEPVWAAIPTPLRRGLGDLAAGLAPHSVLARRLTKAFASASATGDRRISSAFAWGTPGSAAALLAPDLKATATDAEVFAPLDDMLARAGGLSSVEKCLLLERRFFLTDHNLAYTDKMAMAAGVEARVPLLDLDLVRFAAGIPTGWKHHGLTPKWILKQSQRSRLPARVIDRPKSGFGGPLRRWMRGEMRDLTEDLLSPASLAAGGLFDPGEVTRLRRADASGEVDGSYTLFSLMCIELWRRQFLAAATAGGRD